MDVRRRLYIFSPFAVLYAYELITLHKLELSSMPFAERERLLAKWTCQVNVKVIKFFQL